MVQLVIIIIFIHPICLNRFKKTLLYDDNNSIITSNWDKIEFGVLEGSIMRHLLFLVFINDLPMFVKDKSVAMLFADHTSILL
jgi:hypothetical protein